MTTISFPQRLLDLAAEAPDRPAVTVGDQSWSRAELVSEGARLARDLEARGVRAGDFVTIAVPNSLQWFGSYVACWNLGAVPQPVSARLPARELASLVELASPSVVIGADDSVELPGSPVCLPIGHRPDPSLSDEPLPDAVSPAWKAPTSGGSTGRPKLIVSGDPAVIDPEVPPPLELGRDGCLVVPGPLYHNGPAVWACQALLAGNHVVVLERFDAEAVLAAVDRYSADVVYLVPTMMKRIWRLPEEVRDRYDLSSLRVVWHLAEPCPPWLKEVWMDWLGAERIFELYGGTEAQATTIITGPEWLEHPGSVGRPVTGEIQVRDADGEVLPPGQRGEVWMRPTREEPTYRYIGAEPKRSADGWESLGDLGWLDEDGYLYLADRLQDMILSGGANIYPAEVESAILEHPAVRSCAVIGLPDEDRGNTVHAIVEPEPSAGAPGVAELLDFVGERLAKYKMPRSVEFVETALRDDAGKVRRAALRAERVPTG